MTWNEAIFFLHTLIWKDIPAELIFQGVDPSTSASMLKVTVPRQEMIIGESYSSEKRLPGKSDLSEAEIDMVKEICEQRSLICEIYDTNLLIY